MAKKQKKQQGVPTAVRDKVEKQIAEFNAKHFSTPDRGYRPRYKGDYLYLDRVDTGQPEPICRLTYTGEMDVWDFAIYKYSSNRYDPDEWLFPGSELFNGTLTSAMEAGMVAYPPAKENPVTNLFRKLFGRK